MGAGLIPGPFGGKAHAQGPAPAYFAEVPDLPLPPGFTSWADGAAVFEAGALRIVEVMAWGPMSGQPEEFYARTLPALGWGEISRNVWHRDGEVLRLTLARGAAGGPLWIKLRVGPPE